MPDRITPARWQEIEPLLDAALDCAPAGRDAFVMTATASDPALRAELEALLRDAAAGSPLQLLDRSASEVFVSLLRDDSEIVARVFAEEFAGRYTISKRIGAGGMATVYLAHDVRHDREVAIKILHPELTATIGSARFEREIRMTARLQHPHLLPLLDSGEAGGQLFYVMPYVKGESLRARLDRERQLPILDALRITREAASALDNAHRHGAVHRDIKPENILMHEGQALVADWGIALPTAAGERQPLTADGFRLGTPQYMSPEQAVGDRAIDARSDVYSLGCVLYEMLTGEPPFTGATAQVVIDKVKNERPVPPSSVRETVSPPVEAAVLKALAKLPADRFQSAAEFAAALAEPDVASVVLAASVADAAAGAVHADTTRSTAASHRTRYIALVTLVTALAVALGYVMLRGGSPRPVSRLRMALPAGQGISSADSPRFTLSPDGSALAYVGPGPRGRQLWIKKRDQLSSVALAGTDNAEQPVFSPDGRRIAFYVRGANSATVMVVPLDGGAPITLATSEQIGPSEVSSAGFRAIGLAWGSDGYIYTDGEGGLGVRRIRESGGTVEHAAVRDSLNGLVWWPDPLPNGKGVLVTLGRWNARASQYKIAVTDPVEGTTRILVSGTFARYAASGYLLYVTADGALMAAPFDAGNAMLTGPAVKLVDGIDISDFGAADLAISREGMLAYVQGTGGPGSTPVWVTRDGTAMLVDSADRRWRSDFGYGVAISPDGSRLAYASTGDKGIREVWVRQLPRGPLTRVTSDRGGTRPAWRDNNVLLFTFRPSGDAVMDVWTERADGSAPATPLINPGLTIQEFSTVPSTPWVALRVMRRDGKSDLMAIRPGVDKAPVPLLTTPFEERVPVLSPNGRFLAYVSNESGRQEIYVRPFPNVQAGRWQVSAAGGTAPLWSRNGAELFYLSEGNMMATSVRTAPTFAVAEQRALFSVSEYSGAPSRAYDEAPDGRFIMFRRGSGPVQDLVVVENFFAELKRRR